MSKTEYRQDSASNCVKIEIIYNELKEILKNEDWKSCMEMDKLMKKLEDYIRLENSYKTTSKTRVNAIKRIASKLEIRPALRGYGNVAGYQVVTDTYHLVAIHQENMPLELKDNYPNVEGHIKYDTSNEIPMIDLDDLIGFIKTHKKDKYKLYKITIEDKDYFYNAEYLKNVIDVLGKDSKVYFQNEYRPLVFVNDKDEIGLVLPIKKY